MNNFLNCALEALKECVFIPVSHTPEGGSQDHIIHSLVQTDSIQIHKLMRVAEMSRTAAFAKNGVVITFFILL